MPERTAEHVFSVTEITQLIKSSLEEGFPWVTIQGEISNFRPSSAGHWYFSLKDVDAMISVVMFRGRLDAVRFTPADGMLAKASGTISVYAKRGSYQLICETLPGPAKATSLRRWRPASAHSPRKAFST